MIGIGATDDSYDVKYFQETFKVNFPLFTDEDRTIHKMVGEPYTPYFINVKINEKKEAEIISTHLGKIPGADEYLKKLIEDSGLN